MEELLKEIGMDDSEQLLKVMGIDETTIRLISKGADPKRVFNGDLLDGSALLTLSAMTEIAVEDMKDEDCIEELGDELSLAVIGSNFTDGMIVLLKFLAEELSDSHKDYHVNMKFIEKINGLVEQAHKMAHEEQQNEGDD